MDLQFISNATYILSNLFRMYLIYLFIKVFFRTECGQIARVIRFIIYAIFFFANSFAFLALHLSAPVTLLLNVVGVFFVTLSYRGRWSFRIVTPLMIVSINLMLEEIVYKLMINLNVGHVVPIGMIVTDLLLLMMVVLLQKVVDFKQGQELFWPEWISIIVFSTVSMLICASTIDKCEGDISVIIGCNGLLLLDIITYILFDRFGKLHRERLELCALEIQNKAYEKEIAIIEQAENNISSLRHDMKNHIVSLEQLIKVNDVKALEEYLTQLRVALQPEGQFIDTGVVIVDGIVNTKLSEASKILGVDIKCEAYIHSGISIDKSDISILLGNLLDNAIQALARCSEKRMLKFSMRADRGIIFIRVGNTYNGEIHRLRDTFATVKKDKMNHGIGLKNIERIIDKYNGEIKFEYDMDYFRVYLMLFSN
jgi:hypothetical protein